MLCAFFSVVSFFAQTKTQIKSQGRSIQYHGQVAKSQGEALYNYFCDCIRAAVYEIQQRGGGVVDDTNKLPEWFLAWKTTRRLTIRDDDNNNNDNQHRQQPQQQPPFDPSVPPESIFRSDRNYATFDDATGMPLTVASSNTGGEQQPLTKSATKRLRKLLEAHAQRHAKWKKETSTRVAAAASAAAANDAATGSVAPEALKNTNEDSSSMQHTNAVETEIIKDIDWDRLLVETPVVVGSFGMRQGLELQSDMGPFCHVLQI